MTAPARRGFVTSILFVSAAVVIAGCFESDVPLGPPEGSKVNRAYVGDWEFADAEGHRTIYRVRNFDDRAYYVEAENAGAGDAGRVSVERWSAFVVPVKGVDFAHLRSLQDDGSLPAKHTILRVGLADGKLALRDLDGDFFLERDVTTTKKLRRVVEENLDNAGMYTGEPVVGTRLAPP